MKTAIVGLGNEEIPKRWKHADDRRVTRTGNGQKGTTFDTSLYVHSSGPSCGREWSVSGGSRACESVNDRRDTNM